MLFVFILGKIIGLCAGILQKDDLAFVGMYVVKSNLRGLGIGKNLWNRVMERVGDRNAAINTRLENVENYRDRGGFPIVCDRGSVTFTMKDVCSCKMINELPGVDVNLVKSHDANLIKGIADYDANIIGFSRDRLFPILSKEKESVIVAARNSGDNSICGYGIIKQAMNNMAFVGPLYADEKTIAELILYHLIKAFPEATKDGLVLETVDCNEDALSTWERLGFQRYSRCFRLYRHKEVNFDFKKVFVLFSETFCVF